jgi:hypothetical protein
MKAPSGGKVMTFCRVLCATSMTWRAIRRLIYDVCVQQLLKICTIVPAAVVM